VIEQWSAHAAAKRIFKEVVNGNLSTLRAHHTAASYKVGLPVLPSKERTAVEGKAGQATRGSQTCAA